MYPPSRYLIRLPVALVVQSLADLTYPERLQSTIRQRLSAFLGLLDFKLRARLVFHLELKDPKPAAARLHSIIMSNGCSRAS